MPDVATSTSDILTDISRDTPSVITSQPKRDILGDLYTIAQLDKQGQLDKENNNADSASSCPDMFSCCVCFDAIQKTKNQKAKNQKAKKYNQDKVSQADFNAKSDSNHFTAKDIKLLCQ